MVAAIGTGDAFAKGRDFAAWLGLVPRQFSTGDRTGRISILTGHRHSLTKSESSKISRFGASYAPKIPLKSLPNLGLYVSQNQKKFSRFCGVRRKPCFCPPPRNQDPEPVVIEPCEADGTSKRSFQSTTRPKLLSWP
jgi:Transposase IS116/IS110/IS902 family